LVNNGCNFGAACFVATAALVSALQPLVVWYLIISTLGVFVSRKAFAENVLIEEDVIRELIFSCLAFVTFRF